MMFPQGPYNPDYWNRIVTKEVAFLLSNFHHNMQTVYGYENLSKLKRGFKIEDIGQLSIASASGHFISDKNSLRAPYWHDLEEWLRIAYNIEVEKHLTHVEKDDLDSQRYQYRAVIAHQYGRKPFTSITSSERNRREQLSKLYTEVLQWILDNETTIR